MPKTIPWPWKLLSLVVLVFLWASPLQARCSRAESYYHFLVGEYLLEKGAFEKATKEFEKVARCDPQAIIAKQELVRLYAEKGRFEKAVALAKEILAQNPDDKETLFLLAKVYLAQGRTARAIETLETLLEKDPSNHQALSVLAAIYLRQGNVDQAIETLQKLVQKEESVSLWLELANLYRRKGDFDQARKAYKRALALKPGALEIILQYGSFLEKIGAFKEAEELYREGLKENPDSLHLYESLLQLYYRELRFEDTLKLLEEVEQKLGPNPNLLFRKALVLLGLNRDQEAEKILRQLVETYPENYNAWFYLGVALERQGKTEEAIHIYENIPPEAPVFDLALRRLAKLVKDPEKLSVLIERALEKDPQDRNLYLVAGSIFEDLDDCARGYEIVQKGLEKFPDDVDLAVSAGILLVCMGKEEEALKLLEPLLEKHPENPTLLNFVGYTLADLNRDLDRAEKYIRQALKARPESGYIIDSLAWVYYRQGKYEEALKEIKRALKYADQDAIIHEHHGDILLALGREKEALEAYRKALKLAKKKREKRRLEEKIQKLCEKLSCSSS